MSLKPLTMTSVTVSSSSKGTSGFEEILDAGFEDRLPGHGMDLEMLSRRESPRFPPRRLSSTVCIIHQLGENVKRPNTLRKRGR